VDGNTTVNYQCDGNTFNVPSFVAITAANNFGPGAKWWSGPASTDINQREKSALFSQS
jgi:hypothetical protein